MFLPPMTVFRHLDVMGKVKKLEKEDQMFGSPFLNRIITFDEKWIQDMDNGWALLTIVTTEKDYGDYTVVCKENNSLFLAASCQEID